MNREEHIENLKAIASDMPSDKCSDWIESLMAGVKALEQEPCGDAVSRQAVHKTIEKWAGSMGVLTVLPTREIVPLLESIHKLPPVTPQPKMGRWIEENPPMVERYPFCSECGFVNPFENALNYCPNCGTKMSEIPTGSEGSE